MQTAPTLSLLDILLDARSLAFLSIVLLLWVSFPRRAIGGGGGLYVILIASTRAVQALCDAHSWWKLSPRATLGGR